MSSNCITIGWMGELKEPVERGARDTISELLSEHGLGINYEGTLVYTTTDHELLHEAVTCHILDDLTGAPRFYDEVWKTGFAPIRDSIRMFVDIWYDGTDSGHDELTLVEFREKSK